MNPTHDQQVVEADRVIPVRMPASRWRLVVKALRASPDAGNYLVAAAVQTVEDTLGASRTEQ